MKKKKEQVQTQCEYREQLCGDGGIKRSAFKTTYSTVEMCGTQSRQFPMQITHYNQFLSLTLTFFIQYICVWQFYSPYIDILI